MWQINLICFQLLSLYDSGGRHKEQGWHPNQSGAPSRQEMENLRCQALGRWMERVLRPESNKTLLDTTGIRKTLRTLPLAECWVDNIHNTLSVCILHACDLNGISMNELVFNTRQPLQTEIFIHLSAQKDNLIDQIWMTNNAFNYRKLLTLSSNIPNVKFISAGVS